MPLLPDHAREGRMPLRLPRAVALDLGFVAALLILAATVLALTLCPNPMTVWHASAYLSATALLTLLWQRTPGDMAAVPENDRVPKTDLALRHAAVAGLFGILMFVCFFKP